MCNFKSGAINLDLNAYMAAPYVTVISTTTTTSGTKVTAVTTTNGGHDHARQQTRRPAHRRHAHADTKNAILAFVNNTTYFPADADRDGHDHHSPPAPSLPTTSARDRVRAIVQLILASPEYAVQQ